MVGNLQGANFCEKLEKALKTNFTIQSSPGVWCTCVQNILMKRNSFYHNIEDCFAVD